MDDRYLGDRERGDRGSKTVFAAVLEFSQHMHVVGADSGRGWIGYWTHPDAPQGQPTPIVEIDTEATVWNMSGRTLIEACAADLAFCEDDLAVEFTRLTDRLAELGVPASTRDYDARLTSRSGPDELFDDLNDAEFARLMGR
ncbi:hypothetical protein ABT174_39115 [Streptomyces sparsogenes]|uniref:hypothetical protein n=1 Tax=Streptomyces sparsogenes TaxID=67365 RepID=UPI003327C41E